MRFQNQLISLVREKEITPKDTALIILTKDGLKPLSSVGFHSSSRLLAVLEEHDIPFTIRHGRIYIGKNRRGQKDGKKFGFPECCSSLFLNSAGSKSTSPFVFHVPCSGQCEETERLAHTYMTHIKENYPVVAERIMKL